MVTVVVDVFVVAAAVVVAAVDNTVAAVEVFVDHVEIGFSAVMVKKCNGMMIAPEQELISADLSQY